MYAQLTKSQEGYLERKIAEAEAKHKQGKAAEGAGEKERKKEERHEQQRRQYEANFNKQMNNLNSVSAGDYINGPKRNGMESSQATTYKAEVPHKAPVATQRKNGNKLQTNNNSGRNNIGSPSYSGNNYTGDRYNFKRADFGRTLQSNQQTRISENQIRGQYKPSRTMNQEVINTWQTHTPSRASMQRSPQQDNTQNVKSAQVQKKRGIKETKQTANQQRTAPDMPSSQIQQKEQLPVQKKAVFYGKNGNLNIDTSNGLHPNTGQDNSSPDLAMPDMAKPKNATNTMKIKAFALPKNEAQYLSDRDNKTPSTYTGPGRTEMQQYQMGNKDMMNGFASFDNPQEWDYIYGVYYAGKVNTSSRVVTQKR